MTIDNVNQLQWCEMLTTLNFKLNSLNGKRRIVFADNSTFLTNHPSSYRVGGTSTFWKCAVTKPNSISTFHLMVLFYGNNLMENYIFFNYLENYIFFNYLENYIFFNYLEIYMFLFHVVTNAFSIAWLHTTGSLKTTGTFPRKWVIRLLLFFGVIQLSCDIRWTCI